MTRYALIDDDCLERLQLTNTVVSEQNRPYLAKPPEFKAIFEAGHQTLVTALPPTVTREVVG